MIFTTFESIVCDQKIKAFTCFIYFEILKKIVDIFNIFTSLNKIDFI